MRRLGRAPPAAPRRQRAAWGDRRGSGSAGASRSSSVGQPTSTTTASWPSRSQVQHRCCHACRAGSRTTSTRERSRRAPARGCIEVRRRARPRCRAPAGPSPPSDQGSSPDAIPPGVGDSTHERVDAAGQRPRDLQAAPRSVDGEQPVHRGAWLDRTRKAAPYGCGASASRDSRSPDRPAGHARPRRGSPRPGGRSSAAPVSIASAPATSARTKPSTMPTVPATARISRASVTTVAGEAQLARAAARS